MSETAPTARAYEGLTTHVRYRPFERRFSFRLAQILFDIDRLGELDEQLRYFSHNRFNLFSFHDKDHGDRTGAPLRPWAEACFRRAGVEIDGGRIDLLCFPRMLGFVFNPLSIFFGHDRAGILRSVIYEVNNTFGETHAYVASLAPGAAHSHESAKVFHVSPLFDVRGDYRFQLQSPGKTFRLSVQNIVDGAPEHLATLAMRARPLTDTWLGHVFLSMPFMTLQVVAGIHWHALKLFLRGARYRRRPPLPDAAVTLAQAPRASNLNAGLVVTER